MKEGKEIHQVASLQACEQLLPRSATAGSRVDDRRQCLRRCRRRCRSEKTRTPSQQLQRLSCIEHEISDDNWAATQQSVTEATSQQCLPLPMN